MRPMQREIIEQLKVEAEISPQYEVERTVQFLKDYLIAHPFLKTYVLGISGGQDSTLVGKLAQLAVESLRAETKNDDYQFIAVRLPYATQMDEDDAQKALDFIQPDKVMTVNVQSATDALVETIEKEGLAIGDFNKGNIKARQRMVAQYAIAGQLQGAVLGSDHAAESVTGFFTKFGDGAADLMPLWRLTKEQGRQMLRYLNAPAELYEKVPVADLEDDRPMQPDEEALGVTYEAIDRYLTGQEVSNQDAERIEALYQGSRHKRHLPITIFDDFWRSNG
ncbi:ammonia-dependent NAD(+) synthetase [Dolosicoccus paucivorans]|uniref:NH(3)-dependent NAD(+) synthetase n=1 Tax=Dolosicoccus paucivorans TaxID=84521 RepID=A0A1G8LIF7_9LACT|nr:ammonia-dependent NAD(+) synthetase [Dolosicoccus paucivorans]PMB84801.1 ammonia-dependent NAD(+) synthetase [Dolosicoccus paucivorans]PMC58557.1 ammonia-dependent NAD(+) synthetase [Dolosicoccus paucivorans]SDI54990.1 NAD+ synthase [Dolosicoccus paucivorans]